MCFVDIPKPKDPPPPPAPVAPTEAPKPMGNPDNVGQRKNLGLSQLRISNRGGQV